MPANRHRRYDSDGGPYLQATWVLVTSPRCSSAAIVVGSFFCELMSPAALDPVSRCHRRKKYVCEP